VASPDLDSVTRSLEAANLFTEKRLSVETLANITEMIGLQLNIEMRPGEAFTYQPPRGDKKGILTYNRQQLLDLPPQAAPGLIFHEIGHAHNSQSRYNIKQHCGRVATAADKVSKTGKAIHPGNVFSIIEAAEDERMESIMRGEYQNLDKTYLPRVDGGWRKNQWDKDREMLKNVSPPGSLTADGKSLYWERVKTAVRGLVSGAITGEDLPEDMPWDELTVDAVQDLRRASSVDQLMERFSSLVPSFVKFREEYYEPPEQPKNGDGDGDGEGEGEGEGSGSGGSGSGKSKDKPDKDDGKGDGDGKDGKDKDDGKGGKGGPPPITELQDEYDKGTPGEPESSFNNGGGGAGFSPPTTKKKAPYQGPAWSLVRMSASNMIGPIVKQTRKYLRENEIATRSPGYKSGKLHSRSLIRAEITDSDRVYSKPDQHGQLSYAVALLVDASGSMQSFEEDVRPAPEAFGGLGERIEVPGKASSGRRAAYYERIYQPWSSGHENSGKYGAKWTFATRLCVALTEAIAKYREVKLGIFRFDDNFTVVKGFKEPLSQEKKQYIMTDLTGNVDGGTENADAFIQIANQMKDLNVDRRLCIVLTDGQFTDHGTDEAIKYMKGKGIEMVVLTLGVDARVAKRYVGDRFADKVTDDTVGPVLGHHLKRMVSSKVRGRR
jgi:hypothetical protein